MAFDWMSFAEGFMETAATNIKEKKQEARKFQTEQEELSKRNLLKISERNATVNKVMGLSQMLMENGVSKNQIQAAVASGPNAIAELATKVQEAVAAQGGKPLSSADVDSIIRMPKDFAPVDMELDEYVKRSYGLYSPNVGTSEAEKVGFWDKVTGDAAMKRAKGKLDSSVMYEGMTAADINELAAQSDYQAIIPSTFATFSDFKVFDNKARMNVQADIVTQIEVLKETDAEYAAARSVLKDISPSTQIEEEQAQRKAALEIVQRKHRENFGSIFDQAITDYGTRAVTGLQDLMTTYMGAEYVTDIRDTFGSAIKEEGASGVEAKIEDTGGKVIKSDNTVTMSHPEVFAKQDGSALEVTFELDTDGMVISATAGDETFEGEDALILHNEFTTFMPSGVISRDMSKPMTDVPPNVDALSVTREEWEGMTRKQRKDAGLPVSTWGGSGTMFASDEGFAQVDLKRNADPEAMYKITISGLGGSFKVKGSDLKYISDQRLAAEQGGVTISEFEMDEDMPSKTMTAKRLQKMFGEDAKEAVKVEGASDTEQKGLMSSPKPKQRPDTSSLREKAMERFGVTKEDIEEGMDTGKITELDLQVLVEHGDEIYNFMQDKVGEETPSTMQMYSLLTEWADKNRKQLPFDMNFLIYQFQKALSNG